MLVAFWEPFCHPKTIKKWMKINEKSLIFTSILGTILVPFWNPKWSPKASHNPSKKSLIFHRFWPPFCAPFGLPLGSLWRPFGHPIDAVWSQRALPGRSGSSKALHSEPYTQKSSPRFKKWAKRQPQIAKIEPLSFSKIEKPLSNSFKKLRCVSNSIFNENVSSWPTFNQRQVSLFKTLQN